MRLILFDIDGTLVDTAGAGRRAMEQAFAEVCGIDGVASRATGVRFAGMTDPAIFQALAHAIGLDDRGFADRRNAIELAYLAALEREMTRPDSRRRTIPGVVRLLATLDARRDAVLGLVTGNLERGARLKLGPFGLQAYFPGGGFGSDHADRREVARIARDRLARIAGVDFEPASVVVVGDTEHDVDCARANGFAAVAIATGWVARDVLEAARPDALLDDFSDLDRTLAAVYASGR